MTNRTARPCFDLGQAALLLEFIALFFGGPLLVDAYIGAGDPLSTIWLLCALAGGLLLLTPGFSMKLLLRGPGREGWLILLAGAAAASLACLAIALVVAPDEVLRMPRDHVAAWMFIILAYPLFSAVPQELIYRTLFFERYGALMPTPSIAVLMNGGLFAFAHLFMMTPVTLIVTGIAGAFIGWAYLRTRSLFLSILLHGMAGNVAVTLGLGNFLFHTG